MKTLLTSILCAGAGLCLTAQAATVELLPPLSSIAAAGYNSSGRVCSNSITAADVKGWLGARNAGWYTTTGNADMQWGYVSVNAAAQTMTVPNMNGTAGVCAGLVLNIGDFSQYENLTMSFNLTPPGTGPTFTWSIWYDSVTEDAPVLLGKGSRGNNASVWDVSYTVEGSQYADMLQNGNGKIYLVLGSTLGANNNNATVSNISITGTEAAIPEPAAASLGILGLAALAIRRQRR